MNTLKGTMKMSQNIEIEFKNLLTKDEYERLLREFNIVNQQIFSQENHYFDSAEFALKALGSALRLRKKPNGWEMTLKQPADVGLLETNQDITEQDALLAIQYNKLPDGKIQQLLEDSGIPYSKLEYFGSLKTKRVEVEYHKGLLVLDHSIYLNKQDYELEFEANDEQHGRESFLLLLKQYSIPVRQTKNKIMRFYEQKYAD
jgi:uncharacterized protein YjbK